MTERNWKDMPQTKRGDTCSNVHPPNTFTCPSCYVDHDVAGVEQGVDKFIRCDNCGAPLRLEIEMQPNYRSVIADEDEEEENLNDDAHIPDADNPENETGFASFNDTMD